MLPAESGITYALGRDSEDGEPLTVDLRGFLPEAALHLGMFFSSPPSKSPLEGGTACGRECALLEGWRDSLSGRRLFPAISVQRLLAKRPFPRKAELAARSATGLCQGRDWPAQQTGSFLPPAKQHHFRR